MANAKTSTTIRPKAARHFESRAALKPRVEALGFTLAYCPVLRDRDGARYVGLYILEPEADELIIATTGSGEGDQRELEAWCSSYEAALKRDGDGDDVRRDDVNSEGESTNKRAADSSHSTTGEQLIYGIRGVAR